MKVHPHDTRDSRVILGTGLVMTKEPQHLLALYRVEYRPVYVRPRYDERHGPTADALTQLRPKDLGEIFQLAQKVDCNKCERLRATFLRCHLGFCLQENSFCQ